MGNRHGVYLNESDDETIRRTTKISQQQQFGQSMRPEKFSDHPFIHNRNSKSDPTYSCTFNPDSRQIELVSDKRGSNPTEFTMQRERHLQTSEMGIRLGCTWFSESAIAAVYTELCCGSDKLGSQPATTATTSTMSAEVVSKLPRWPRRTNDRIPEPLTK